MDAEPSKSKYQKPRGERRITVPDVQQVFLNDLQISTKP